MFDALKSMHRDINRTIKPYKRPAIFLIAYAILIIGIPCCLAGNIGVKVQDLLIALALRAKDWGEK